MKQSDMYGFSVLYEGNLCKWALFLQRTYANRAKRDKKLVLVVCSGVQGE